MHLNLNMAPFLDFVLFALFKMPTSQWIKHDDPHLPSAAMYMAAGHYDQTIYLLYDSLFCSNNSI